MLDFVTAAIGLAATKLYIIVTVLSPQRLASRRQNLEKIYQFCHRSDWPRGDKTVLNLDSFVTAEVGFAATKLYLILTVLSPQRLASRQQNQAFYTSFVTAATRLAVTKP